MTDRSGSPPVIRVDRTTSALPATDIVPCALVGVWKGMVPMAERFHLWTICGAIGLAVLPLAGTAAAETCLDRVLAVGARYGVPTDPPTAGPGDSDVTARDLAKSGNVIEPERTKDNAVVAPPAGKSYGMPTLPDVKTKQESPGIDLTALQAVLVAARAQAERGNQAGCRATLAKVDTIVERGT